MVDPPDVSVFRKVTVLLVPQECLVSWSKKLAVTNKHMNKAPVTPNLANVRKS